MIIKEIDKDVFSEFANNHVLKNFFQTKEYGDLMSHSDFSVMYIGGYVDEMLVAGSLILHKTMGPSIRYGYAPRGFLLDYYDEELLATFTKKVKDFFFKKRFEFIKINPEITFSKIDFDNKSKTINSKSNDLVERLKSLGYCKLKDNLYFESLLPKYTPVIYLPKYDVEVLDNTTKANVKEAELSGISLIKGTADDIETFYKFVEDKDDKTMDFYKYFYDEFSKSDMVDLLLVELDYINYSKYLQKQYIYESERNEVINSEFNDNPQNNDIYNLKMKSDQKLAKVSEEISTINQKVQDNDIKEILGSAFVVKH